ncbi:NF-X1-type zinc finger protein NFXL1-like [Anneissia japonica]|uniref:NF-X1-type zinc finger protein NFXL1-like n=1 Tax=Anneissia japonica TaxID=1529436 RepID=UPI001425B40B|nr:NF-X1-type zinc finger protein NFXL1-like [Anneissia japonica]
MAEPSTYSFLGRGRGGRGRGHPRDHSSTKYSQDWRNYNEAQRNGGGATLGARSKNIETEKQHEHQPAQQLQEHQVLEDEYETSSDEDEASNYQDILKATYKDYSMHLGDSNSNEAISLQHQFQSEKTVCLICIETVKREEEIWYCQTCYCILHLQCIQKWAQEGSVQKNFLSEENFPEAEKLWHCPNCRFEYKKSECPSRYVCHCGKEVDPKPDPWLTPHTCGQTCGKPLKPLCNHQCLLLCHPGACPPCPKTICTSCFCGREAPTLKRCSASQWSCQKPCAAKLECGHKCDTPCHAGDCPPCPKMSQRSCLCGRLATLRSCESLVWQCNCVCGKVLSCGNHTCEEVCHEGKCKGCPRAENRSCPCGKTKYQLPCTEDVPTCGDTCNKLLECGLHQCTNRCHTGPCENVSSFMTTGLCYPCRELSKIQCNCGKTVQKVRCGMERVTKPPRCKQSCSTPPSCHHIRREPHHCHFGQCPPCRQLCDKPLSGCSHRCPKGCHDDVTVKHVEQKPRPAGPWEKQPEVQYRQVALPCPPCLQPVPVDCFGKHETHPLPCSQARSFSCQRTCGRLLLCGNHRCQLECHVVTGATSDEMAGSECMPCEEKCSKPRPQDCPHKCQLPCHSTQCPTCEKSNKMRCHCRNMLLYVKCSEWTKASASERDEKQSCKGPCPQMMSCDHLCSKQCHSGDCALPSECTGKKAIKCPCKRRKKNFPCPLVQSNEAKLECDDNCKQLIEKQKKLKEEEELRNELELKKQQMRDEEEFKRVMNKGKKHRRRKNEEIEYKPWWRSQYVTIGAVLLLALIFGFYLMNM